MYNVYCIMYIYDANNNNYVVDVLSKGFIDVLYKLQVSILNGWTGTESRKNSNSGAWMVSGQNATMTKPDKMPQCKWCNKDTAKVLQGCDKSVTWYNNMV